VRAVETATVETVALASVMATVWRTGRPRAAPSFALAVQPV
jgi:hypothetical protein